MDLATMARVHDLAAVYGGVGLEQDENNLNFPYALKINELCRLCRLCTIFGR